MEQLQDEQIKITFQYGHLELKRQRPLLIRKSKRKWYGFRSNYWIRYEFCEIGPIRDLADAEYFYNLAVYYNDY